MIDSGKLKNFLIDLSNKNIQFSLLCIFVAYVCGNESWIVSRLPTSNNNGYEKYLINFLGVVHLLGLYFGGVRRWVECRHVWIFERTTLKTVHSLAFHSTLHNSWTTPKFQYFMVWEKFIHSRMNVPSKKCCLCKFSLFALPFCIYFHIL